MQKNLRDIQHPIAEELIQFNKYFMSAMKTRVMLLDKIMQYIVRQKGKQMRPMFVLLAARICGEINPRTYRGAALVELLHTATLVHDDVVDGADERRGFFSINAIWKNKVAVLVGDFLLSRGLLMSLEHDDFDLLKITSNAVRLMSEGELLQMEKARRLNVDEPVYFEIIRQKTASLIAACCECGAASSNPDKEIIEKMRQFGEYVGMAFQVRDDLFDYGVEEVGKPLGIDIREKKLTLPLIYSLNKSSWSERRKVINIVRNHNRDRKKVRWVMEFVEANGGIEYSRGVMEEYTSRSHMILNQFPDSPARQSMSDLINYTINRSK